MASPSPPFSGSWRQSLPLRWRGLMGPYGQAMGFFLAAYAGLTALFRPWALGHWWSIGVPVAAGLGVCWWLWRPWARMARNSRGETRHMPLLVVWLVVAVAGCNLRNYLRLRLGAVYEVRSARAQAPPGKAVFFRVQHPFYLAKSYLGHYAFSWVVRQKNGTHTYSASCFYACPLLATAADTATRPATPLAWLGYSAHTTLGNDLTPGERNWRYVNFVARTDARLDSANLRHFSYLVLDEYAPPGLYRAVRASGLAPYWGSPLLLTPVQGSFTERGTQSLRLLGWTLVLGSGFVSLLLFTLPLRSSE
jgi:hypothetical protein